MEWLKNAQSRFDEALSATMDDPGMWRAESLSAGGLKEMLTPCIMGGGHRLRPLLFLAMLEGLGGVITGEMLKLAVALELMHHFALIHDDIIDRSESRRGVRTLHEEFRQRYAGGFGNLNGTDFALLAGDFLYMASQKMLAELDISPGHTVEMGKLISGTARLTCLGQYLEMEAISGGGALDSQAEREIQGLKTAHYTFICPMKIGAILTDAGTAIRGKLEGAGRLWGTAFQMRDDLDDFLPGPRQERMRPTSPCWRLLAEHGSEEARAILSEALRRGELTEAMEESLAVFFQKAGLHEHCMGEIRRLEQAGWAEMGDIPLHPEPREALRVLVSRALKTG